MVDTIVSITVQKLGDFLTQEATFLHGVKDVLVSIRDELIWMQSFLNDAEQKQGGNEGIRSWIAEIQDIASKTEDTISAFNKEIKRKEPSKKKLLPTSLQKFFCTVAGETNVYDKSKAITTLEERLSALEQRLADISRKREVYGITYSCNTQDRRSTTASLVDEGHFVGLDDDDFNQLQAQLFLSESRHKVISILGMGGLGKTSLARKLYNTNKWEFEFHAWVSVSQAWNTEDLLARIIKSLKKPTYDELKEFEKMDIDKMKRYLFELLKDKLYLVVIDDMWDEEALEFLKSALPDNQKKSRVIITTHNEYVDKLSDQTLKLRHLRADESWELFCKNAFSNQNGAHSQDVEEIGKEMVAKCDGLPLAIIVLGGLLWGKESNEWHVIKKYIWRALIATSIHISALLDLSYNDLSNELKPCVLYLGIFPEDYEIRKEKLIQMWIVEGLITQSEEHGLEELAEAYIKELSVRSLIQLVTTEDTLNPTYRVHDLVRDLAITNAKELDFFHIYEESMYPTIVPFSTKRIAFRSGFESYMATVDDLSYSQVHTLSFLNYHSVLDDGDATKLLTLINTKFKSLRVLDLDGVVTAQSKLKFLESMEKLVNLKYLGLSQIDIDKRPESVGNLQAVQAVDVISKTDEIIAHTALQDQQRDLRRPTSLADEEHFIGLDDDVKLLKKQLFSSELTRCVVSILGRGGSGKTTLARKLYHTHKNSFELHAWVCVPREWNAKYLLRRIIKSFKELTTDELSKLENMKDEDDMKRYLQDLLKDRKYLVVIDNIWDEEAWECLESALPDNQNGSRVIITTRKKTVAELSGPRTYVHKLRRLRADESWELFCKKAFSKRNGACPHDWKKIGKKMVAKCDGLPLAIIVLGALLSRKEPNEWQVVKKHVLKIKIKKPILLSSLLDLSYNDLSRELKSCFLHLCIFSEDYEIGTEELVRLWIDDDLIPQSEGHDLDELAESYINELNARCLIQFIRSNDSSTSICRVHELLQDFAIDKAKEIEYFSSDKATVPSSMRRIARHLELESIKDSTLMGKAEYGNKATISTSTSRFARHWGFPKRLFRKSSKDSTLMGKAEYGNKAVMTREDEEASSDNPSDYSIKTANTFGDITEKLVVGSKVEEASSHNPSGYSRKNEVHENISLVTAVRELLEAVKDVKKDISTFKPILERLESTLTTITPCLEEIAPLNQSEIDISTQLNLNVLIRDGKELVIECSQLSRHHTDKKCRIWVRLCDLDCDLSGYFISVLQVDQYKVIEKVQDVLLKLWSQLYQPYDFVLEKIREATSSNNPSYYFGKKAMTREDRAREAVETIQNWNKRAVRNHVETRETQSRNGFCTKFFLYNATGSSVTLVGTINSFGDEWSEPPCPSQIENGQWGGFLRVEQFGYKGAVVYRGKNLKDEYCDWICSWRNPSRFQLAASSSSSSNSLQSETCVFTQICEADRYQQCDWLSLYDKMKRSAKKHKDTWNGCSSSMTIETGTTAVVEAILTLKL